MSFVSLLALSLLVLTDVSVKSRIKRAEFRLCYILSCSIVGHLGGKTPLTLTRKNDIIGFNGKIILLLVRHFSSFL